MIPVQMRLSLMIVVFYEIRKRMSITLLEPSISLSSVERQCSRRPGYLLPRV